MRTHCLFAIALAAATLGAQTPNYCDAKFANDFDVISTATSANTGRNLPAGGLQPPGFQVATGVAAGHRVWTYVPDERFQAGSDPYYRGAYMTVTGFTQTIFVGPEVNTFPTTTQTYQMETGIANADPWGSYYRHTTNGNAVDFVVVPQSTLSVPNAGAAIYDHSFTLATPIALPIRSPQPKLILYCAYRGGEYINDPNGGQSLEADWKGGWGLTGQVYWGFASPPTNGLRTVMTVTGPYRGKIGLLLDEPVFHAAGLHGNRYDTGARQGERFRGITVMASDWGYANWSNSTPTLWFDFEGGQRYGNNLGAFTVLFNLGTSWFPLSIPFGFGNLLLNPGDPLLFGFPEAGQAFYLDQNGQYVGSGFAYPIPPFGPSGVGQWVKLQGICANLDPATGIRDIALTNSVSMKIIN